MKVVKIYSIGSCNPSSGSGWYEVLLEYKGYQKYLAREIEGTTTNRCIIQGLIDAVTLLKQPCKLELVTTIPIGLSCIKRGKGRNLDLIQELISTLETRKCSYDFTPLEGKGAEINKFVRNSANRQKK